MAESSTDDGHSTKEVPANAKESDRKSRKSLFQRSFSILGHLFHRTSKEDFERKLQSLSKEEATVHTRMKRRSQTWRKLAQGVIVYSIIMELLVLGLAVISTRGPGLSWQMRAVRVLPVFVCPTFSILLYTILAKYYRMREQKDQKTLDRLREERQAKINELKERTNFYLTQELIQKYDSDPTAKEAAARVLAAKLGAESGLKLASESSEVDWGNVGLVEAMTAAPGQVDSSGLRRRASVQKAAGLTAPLSNDIASSQRNEQWQQIEQLSRKPSGGLVAKLAAMLVGEDPNQCYALICRKCHMHNGLCGKEEFPHIKYYCPHCNFFNVHENQTENGSVGNELHEQEKSSQSSLGASHETVSSEQSHEVPKGSTKILKKVE
ncbi:hypothetical protein KP509_16G055300 [Ceratopteris richardii]|uniref:Lunapark zinc ribbon domain-containing protein n=1 Tax=Ceratopteris richardii TaxID=49495 RepID=A0A8T2SZ24_CERRI|nr:hypothetical protein KP509_16G055300 [Ceratopteris richardii]KAH7388056.1 hypothetical protein KP509_16G055300 [Ceratopteris richardii]KAH7388057.1 hypothetical protein KP509_16G055300 [Ceratopteris richardii]KAH7388058.1 hypothetical protein KP509_16G055300 [Ceratopteris richardii]KAH7388059.1 hypothetical protein KP509_16G055300 [Ceratopteris richardii]